MRASKRHPVNQFAFWLVGYNSDADYSEGGEAIIEGWVTPRGRLGQIPTEAMAPRYCGVQIPGP